MNKFSNILCSTAVLASSLVLVTSAFAGQGTITPAVQVSFVGTVNPATYAPTFNAVNNANYNTADPGNGYVNWSIYSNSPTGLTATVTSSNFDASNVYMTNPSDTSGGLAKIPYTLKYQPCGTGASAINLTPVNGSVSVTLTSAQANQSACTTNPGQLEVIRGATASLPDAGAYSDTVTVTLAQPA